MKRVSTESNRITPPAIRGLTLSIKGFVNFAYYFFNVSLSKPLVELSFQIPRNAVIIAMIATGF